MMNNPNIAVQFLQYIWVEKYKCLEDFETNFTNRVLFHYDKNKNVISCVQTNKGYVNNYLNANMSLSCIVGRNGAGKTTILRFIKEILSKEYGGVDRDCIVITYNGHTYDCWYYLSINDTDNQTLTTDCDFLKLHNHEYQVKKEAEWHNTPLLAKLKSKPICHFSMQSARYIFCSNSYSPVFYHHSMGRDELVPSSMIFNNKDPDHEVFKDPLNIFYLDQFNLQLDLLSNIGTKIEEFSVRFPTFVSAYLINEKEQFDKWFEEYTKNSNSIEKSEYEIAFKDFIVLRDNNPMDTFMDHMGRAAFYSIIYEISHTYPKIAHEEFVALITHIKSSTLKGAYENITLFLNDDSFWQTEAHMMLFPNRQKYLSFLLYFKKLTKINYKDEYPLYNPLLSGNAAFIIPVKNDIPSSNSPFFPKGYIHTDIKDFFLHYREAAVFHSFIHFSWGLSDGEQALLDLYSRLFSLSKKNKYNPTADEFYLATTDNDDRHENNAILLLDEIDNSLHPEWQRIIVSSLIGFVQNIYKGTNIQIIFTTHSPIILSDIPKQNTVFLQIDNESGKTVTIESDETFAANIYSLFKSSFFFDKSMIGAFAEQKLKELAKDIQATTKPSISIENRINMIGDIYIRRQFLKLYHKNIGTTSDIQVLQNRIRELEQELSNLKGNTTNQEGDSD